MRISDWSSDVCSSDLPRVWYSMPRSPHRIPNSRGIAYTSFWRWEEVGGLVRLDSQQTATLRRSDRERFSAEVKAFVEGKIGRASCRERGGQYVEISVVAVSFKKKNENKGATKH